MAAEIQKHVDQLNTQKEEMKEVANLEYGEEIDGVNVGYLAVTATTYWEILTSEIYDVFDPMWASRLVKTPEYLDFKKLSEDQNFLKRVSEGDPQSQRLLLETFSELNYGEKALTGIFPGKAENLYAETQNGTVSSILNLSFDEEGNLMLRIAERSGRVQQKIVY